MANSHIRKLVSWQNQQNRCVVLTGCRSLILYCVLSLFSYAAIDGESRIRMYTAVHDRGQVILIVA